MDGGITYHHIHSFPNDESVTDFDLSEQRVAFLTSSGQLYHSRPRSYQMLELSLILQNVCKVVFDSTGELNAIGLHTENGTIVSMAIPLVSYEEVNFRAYTVYLHNYAMPLLGDSIQIFSLGKYPCLSF